jgi:hypothetical protein
MRLAGVVLISVLYFFAVAVVALVGIASIAGISIIPRLGIDPRIAAALGHLTGATAAWLFLPAAILVLLGWKLLALHNWARVLTIILAIAGIVALFLGMTIWGLQFSRGMMAVLAARVVINAAIAWYLLRPPVKRAFTAAQGSAAA